MAGLMQNQSGDMIGHWHDEADGPCWSFADVNIGDDAPDRDKTMCEKGVPIVDNPRGQGNCWSKTNGSA